MFSDFLNYLGTVYFLFLGGRHASICTARDTKRRLELIPPSGSQYHYITPPPLLFRSRVTLNHGESWDWWCLKPEISHFIIWDGRTGNTRLRKRLMYSHVFIRIPLNMSLYFNLPKYMINILSDTLKKRKQKIALKQMFGWPPFSFQKTYDGSG